MAEVVDVDVVVRLGQAIADGAMTPAEAIELLDELAVDEPDLPVRSMADVRGAMGDAACQDAASLADRLRVVEAAGADPDEVRRLIR